jgi:hypothetical protein
MLVVDGFKMVDVKKPDAQAVAQAVINVALGAFQFFRKLLKHLTNKSIFSFSNLSQLFSEGTK